MSSNRSSDYSPVSDFIIWGIFAFIFIIVPFQSVPLRCLIERICRCLGFETDQQDSDSVDSDGRPIYSVSDRDYEYLSHRTKNRINEIRDMEISKRLAAYSLELTAENMISRQHDKDGHDKDEHGGKEEYIASQDSYCIDEEDPKETQDEANHFTLQEKHEGEAASNASTDDTEASTEASTDASNSEEEANYTHVCLPLPGYNKNGLRKPKKKKSSSSTPDNNNRIGLVLFRRQKKDASKQTKELSGEDDDAEVTEQDVTQQKDDRREVPIFCAVCLGEYETSERVCWSSNTECTHVFHHDCMLQWLKSLGKRACKQQRFSENPSVQQVMNFTMKCPCCRQSFIDKSVDVDVGAGVGDDENV